MRPTIFNFDAPRHGVDSALSPRTFIATGTFARRDWLSTLDPAIFVMSPENNFGQRRNKELVSREEFFSRS